MVIIWIMIIFSVCKLPNLTGEICAWAGLLCQVMGVSIVKCDVDSFTFSFQVKLSD